MKKNITRLALGGLLSLAMVTTATAQSTPTEFTLGGLTREGTQIVNTATATYTDANGNSYAQLSASVTVVVGFLANLDIAAVETQAPQGPSSDNRLVLTVTNNGNGADEVQLATVVPTGITNVRYELGGVQYASLAALNAALAANPLEADATTSIVLVYDVLDGFGGQPLTLSAAISSTRAPGQTGGTDTNTTIITPVRTDGVNVAPDGATSARLPSNGTSYSETFTISNTGNLQETFLLTASLPAGTVMTIVSVNGTAGSASSITIPASQSAVVTVVYTVGNDAPAGTSNVLTLTAVAQSSPNVTDDGTINVTVIRPAVTMSKQAYQNGRTAQFGSAAVLPGQFIEYKITVTNGGSTPASSVVVTDALPAQVTYVSAEGDLAGWSFARSGVGGNTVTATLNGVLGVGESRYVWIRTQVK